MSKAYLSNLSQDQYKFLRDLLPEAKPSGRPHEVDLWEVLNAIFHVLVEGVRWRALIRRLSNVAEGLHLLPQLAPRRHLGVYPRPPAGVDKN